MDNSPFTSQAHHGHTLRKAFLDPPSTPTKCSRAPHTYFYIKVYFLPLYFSIMYFSNSLHKLWNPWKHMVSFFFPPDLQPLSRCKLPSKCLLNKRLNKIKSSWLNKWFTSQGIWTLSWICLLPDALSIPPDLCARRLTSMDHSKLTDLWLPGKFGQWKAWVKDESKRMFTSPVSSWWSHHMSAIGLSA